MNQVKVKQIRKAIENALNASQELKDLDVSFQLGNCRYDTKAAKFIDLLFIDKDEQGGEVTKGAMDFEKHYKYYGMTPGDFGKEVVINGKKFKISGINPKATKNPIMIIGEDGRSYKCSMETVLQALRR